MSDWSSGYVTEIDYSYGYYDQLNPLQVPFALLSRGIKPPRIEVACELGFGQGVTIAIHSAASAVEWWGTDFNPSQAGLAQALAHAAGARAKLFDESFADFCARPDLPDFDFIALHGIFSWVSDANRALIVDFLRRKLKVGGVAYVSYNALPGWSAFQSMRHLLVEHAALFGSAAQGIEKRLGEAMAFGQRLLAAEPLYAQASPAVTSRLQVMAGLNSTYLAHELFDRDWVPMHFTDMKRWLEPAKLSFVTSADHLEVVTPMLLTPAQQEVVESVPDPTFRELVLDFMVNRQFRRDYWVKGPRPVRPLEIAERISRESVVLARPRAAFTFRLEGALREITLDPAVFGPILDALADHRPVSVGALSNRLVPAMPLDSLCESLRVLWAAGVLRAAQGPEQATRARASAQGLNTYLLERARSDGSIQHLASAVTGGGLPVSRTVQLFLLARARGEPPARWAESTWHLLAAQGERLQVDGRRLESPEDNLQLLRAEVAEFCATQLPVLETLGVVPAAG